MIFTSASFLLKALFKKFFSFLDFYSYFSEKLWLQKPHVGDPFRFETLNYPLAFKTLLIASVFTLCILVNKFEKDKRKKS